MDSSESVQAAFEVLLQSLSPQSIPVKRVRNLTRIVYASAIAHSLAAQAQLPITIVAAEFAKLLGQWLQQPDFCLGLPIPIEAQSTLKIQATPSGLIEIEFTDRTIALWLNALFSASEIPLQHSSSDSKLQPEVVFAAQHSYARCCSLLSLGHSEKLITLNSLDSEAIDWQFSLPLLGSNLAELRLSLSTHRFLSDLFSLWEALWQPIEQPNKLLTAANQSFQQFHGDVQLFAPPADQTNWLLLLAAQRVIYRLLEELQLPVPTEL